MGNTAPEIWFPNLGIEIKELDNVAFQIAGFNIYFYGIIISTAFLLGFGMILFEAKRSKQNADDYVDFMLYLIIASIIGARLYYVIFSWDNYKDNIMEIFAIRSGGLAIYGGIIAGVITGILFTRKRKLNIWLFADTVVPGLILGQAIGRWGNFFNREAFGGYTDSMFAMRYLKSQVLFVPASVATHTITERGAQYIQVHPTFLYESLWNIGLLAIMLFLRKNKRFDGETTCIYFYGYALGRLWIEGMRTDQLKLWQTNIAVSQLLSALIIVGSLLLYLYLKKHAKQTNQDI